jgi:hypothetical protein
LKLMGLKKSTSSIFLFELFGSLVNCMIIFFYFFF